MSAHTAVDTRSKIQDVALRLFIEHGYEATSLREIAEEVGVTKAALYYHFKTKDEIVTSLIDDRADRLEALIEWGRSLPRTHEARVEFIRRYAEDLHEGRHHETIEFFERNQTALRGHPKNERMLRLMMSMINFLAEEDAGPADKLRSALAVFAIHATSFVLRDLDATERQDTGLEVALGLIR